MIKNYIILVLLFVSVSANAQQVGPNISFEKLEHDFGQVTDNKGNVDYTFIFTNTGNQPLILNAVRPSCGCTTPNYSKQPVLPGSKGEIEVRFNPKGRSGPFHKQVTVTSNANEPTVILHIRGNVVRGKKSIEEIYHHKMGGIRLKQKHLYIPKITPEETKTATVEIINTSDKPVTLAFNNVPTHITMQTIPEKLNPGEKGQIKATFDASKVNAWGSVNRWIQLSTDGNRFDHNINVYVNIQEDFSKLTAEEIKNAPKATFTESRFDYGKIKAGDVIEHDFILENKGKNDLIIRKVKASCGCTAVNPSKTVVKSGEKVPIRVKFDSSGRRGKQNKTVTVITNDPKNFKTVLWVQGTVEM